MFLFEICFKFFWKYIYSNIFVDEKLCLCVYVYVNVYVYVSVYMCVCVCMSESVCM